tara:strand:- start:75923 stop:77338 length:1416 start_codon:yes stop_codon:yes gene_type:complete
MKKLVFCIVVLGFCFTTEAQQLTLRKGAVIDSLKINDSISESYALFLPKSFDVKKQWPVLFVFDIDGRGKQVLQMFLQASEKQGYIIAASNSIYDSIAMSENIQRASRMMNNVISILPINGKRIYTAGFSEGGKFASVLPVVIKNIEGVVSINAPMANTDVLNAKAPFHYIGIVGGDDYNLSEMELTEKILNGLRFPNQLFLYNQGVEPTSLKYIEKALEVFTLTAMAKGVIAKDQSFIDESYKRNVDLINRLIDGNMLLEADQLLSEIIEIYRVHVYLNELKAKQKKLRRDKIYKAMKRNESNAVFKESFLREDYDYAMYEDIATYNFNNLGWWNYQMQVLKKYSESQNVSEKRMGKRLIGFVNHLVESNSEELKQESTLDEEGLNFLWMLKTLTNPTDYKSYINVIAYNAKVEDFGTALFYLEELLKVGYNNKKELYNIDNTALLRITPEYNELIEKYLKDARYDVNEQ